MSNKNCEYESCMIRGRSEHYHEDEFTITFNRKWNNCKQKLPEDNQIVLVINQEGEMAVCKAEIRPSEWGYLFMLYNTSLQITKVTHWMDLPEPPKEI